MLQVLCPLHGDGDDGVAVLVTLNVAHTVIKAYKLTQCMRLWGQRRTIILTSAIPAFQQDMAGSKAGALPAVSLRETGVAPPPCGAPRQATAEGETPATGAPHARAWPPTPRPPPVPAGCYVGSWLLCGVCLRNQTWILPTSPQSQGTPPRGTTQTRRVGG